MDFPTVVKIFEKQNEEKVEKQDLTYQLFKDIDYTILKNKTSYYRSDFRGSRFENITFAENNFDIADFINNTFFNVEFLSVIWGEAEIKNCYFQKCQFKNNKYTSVPFTNTTFIKCDFSNEIFRLTMKDCTFVECTFKNCIFDQCSTDSIRFENCIVIKCEFSTMHAENYQIIDCIFRDTYLGINFLGTYLMKGTDFNLLSFKYRGEIVPITDEKFFDEYTYSMFKYNRYYEYLNLIILLKPYNLNLEDEFVKIIENFNNITNPNLRKYTIKCILEMLEFYLGSEHLNISSFCNILIIISQRINMFSQIEQLEIECGLFRLKSIMCSLNMDIDYLLDCNPSQIVSAELTFDTNDKEQAQKELNSLFTNINKKILDSYYTVPYKIISIRKGSIIITITVSLMLLLLTAKVIKTVCHSMCRMTIEVATSKKMLEIIDHSKTPITLSKAMQAYNTIDGILKDEEDEMNNLVKLIIKLPND